MKSQECGTAWGWVNQQPFYIFVFLLFLLKCWLCPCPFPKCYFWMSFPLLLDGNLRERTMSAGQRECLSLLMESIVSFLWARASAIWASWLAGARPRFIRVQSWTECHRLQHPTHQRYETLKWVTDWTIHFGRCTCVFRTLFWWGYQTSETTSENTFGFPFSSLIILKA